MPPRPGLSRRLRAVPGLSRPAYARSPRLFSTSQPRCEILDAALLQDRIIPTYKHSPTSSLLSLHWPEAPRNVLLMPKLHAPHVTASALAFAKHLHSQYPNINLIFEASIANSVHESLPFPIYSAPSTTLPGKLDVVTTLGGDGTILRAASLFNMDSSVPPILAFSMGSLGFLGEWKFEEHKRAFQEVYMSGRNDRSAGAGGGASTDWIGSAGAPAKILLRHRVKVGIYDPSGNNISRDLRPTSIDPTVPSTQYEPAPMPPQFHAINELLIHRGQNPHLAIIDVYLNDEFLTEAVADGILISTPTGSTAYSLSAGGAIVHPLVKSLLLTPICPRSLSFRPLVLPLNTRVSLKLSKKNRGRELDVTVDGKRRAGVGVGMEIRVEGENVGKAEDGSWRGGVPCVVRVPAKGEGGQIGEDDGWVGGLNGLLKFNYPFGE